MELVLTLAVATAAVISPSGVELERLADNSITPPGIVGNFYIDMVPPVPCAGAVLFNGVGNDLRTGVYSASPTGVTVIANVTTPVPGSAETFQEAIQQDCAAGRIVFLGDDDLTPSSSGPSVYSYNRGVIVPLLEVGATIGDNEFSGFGDVDANTTMLALDSRLVPTSTTQALVIKPFDGDPFIIADRTTVLPGQTAPATIFSQPVLVGSDLVFHARTGLNLGIYRWTEGEGISIVADTLTPVPALGGGTFFLFDWIASLDYGVIFGAGYPGGFGLFVVSGGQVEPLIVPGHVTVDGETITSAGLPSGAGSLLSFSARTADNAAVAIFVRTRDGRVKRILGLGDTIEGRTVNFINGRADHNTVAMQIDSLGPPPNQVIYRARFGDAIDIPGLSISGIAALALALALAALSVLRRAGHCWQAEKRRKPRHRPRR